MTKRLCFNCNKYLPPETDHFQIDCEAYCTECVEARPYAAYQYYVAGDYVADTSHDDAMFVESYEDEHEE